MQSLLIEVDGRALRFDVPRLLRIGRSIEADVVLAAGSVSRQHAELRPVEDGWVVVDSGSQYGTYVDGRRISEHRVTGPVTIQCGPPSPGSSLKITPDVVSARTRAASPVPVSVPDATAARARAAGRRDAPADGWVRRDVHPRRPHHPGPPGANHGPHRAGPARGRRGRGVPVPAPGPPDDRPAPRVRRDHQRPSSARGCTARSAPPRAAGPTATPPRRAPTSRAPDRAVPRSRRAPGCVWATRWPGPSSLWCRSSRRRRRSAGSLVGGATAAAGGGLDRRSPGGDRRRDHHPGPRGHRRRRRRGW